MKSFLLGAAALLVMFLIACQPPSDPSKTEAVVSADTVKHGRTADQLTQQEMFVVVGEYRGTMTTGKREPVSIEIVFEKTGMGTYRELSKSGDRTLTEFTGTWKVSATDSLIKLTGKEDMRMFRWAADGGLWPLDAAGNRIRCEGGCTLLKQAESKKTPDGKEVTKGSLIQPK